MGQRLKNKVAIVIGAGSIGPGWGNGKATAVLFAREGARIFAVDINLDAALETQSIIQKEGGQCTAHRADVTDNAAVEALVEACLAAYGRIDILHNNVGIVEVGGCVEASEESWDRVNQVNVKSVFLACKHVLPHMERQGGGAIVNISSVAGVRWLGVPYVSYSASKGAVNQLTQSIALQYAKKNIRANAVLPGFMETPMVANALSQTYAEGDVDKMVEIRNQLCPSGKMGDAWDVAHAALFLASDEAKYITGTQLVVDGGLTCSIGA
ncbi:MAG: glucose 1-dehydrogenase [Candidatus Latescibacteria bacterium]|nr:glucose 1-dehydrogenase [Candidatus Latescibacterota bacterium]